MSVKQAKSGILIDVPVDHDQFDLHPRDNIASAIFNLILESAQSGAIALIGPMGSGKSSIVKMLENKRRAKDEKDLGANGSIAVRGEKTAEKGLERIQIFVFDAWAHQGESLRRIFLTQLGNFLLKRDSSNPIESMPHREWEHELKSKLSVQQISREVANPTIWGGALAIATFFTALGLLFLSRDSRARMVIIELLGSIPFMPALDDADKVGTFFIGIAISVMLAVLLYFATAGFFNRQKANAPHPFLMPQNNLAREIISSTTLQTLDPSSFEFEELFKSLMERYSKLQSSSNWKLLIVVDNLDRVPNDVVWNLWSTLQVFLELRNSQTASQGASWWNNVWILAAFDQEVLIQNILRMEFVPKRSKTRDTSSSSSSTDPKARDDQIRALVAKTFQVTFHVPPPNLKAWQEFFTSQYNILFSSSTGSPDEVLTVYRICRSKMDLIQPPTPREIKLFLNNLWAISLRPHSSAIPVEVRAIYAFFEEDFSNSRNLVEVVNGRNILSDSVLQSLRNPKSRNECIEYLTALHYGIEQSKVGQELVEAALREALFAEPKDNTQKLHNSVNTCQHGLPTLIYKIIQDDEKLYDNRSGPIVCNLAKNLDYAQEMYRNSHPPQSQDAQKEEGEWTKIWEKVCEIAYAVSDWSQCNRGQQTDLSNRLTTHKCKNAQEIGQRMDKQRPKRAKLSVSA